MHHRADKNIGAMAAELSGKIGEKISVRRFVRYELGEGIEKKKSDLAAEVTGRARRRLKRDSARNDTGRRGSSGAQGP